MAGSPKKRARLLNWRDWSAKKAAIDELCNWVSRPDRDAHLSGFCVNKGFAYNTVLNWIDADTTRSAMYARARQSRADHRVEQMQAIAEDCKPTPGDVAKAKLQIDTIKWESSKLNPKRYGDKVAVEGNGENGEIVHKGAFEVVVKSYRDASNPT